MRRARNKVKASCPVRWRVRAVAHHEDPSRDLVLVQHWNRRPRPVSAAWARCRGLVCPPVVQTPSSSNPRRHYHIRGRCFSGDDYYIQVEHVKSGQKNLLRIRTGLENLHDVWREACSRTEPVVVTRWVG